MRLPHRYAAISLLFFTTCAYVTVEAQPQRRQGPQDDNQQRQRGPGRGEGRRRDAQPNRGQGQGPQQRIVHPAGPTNIVAEGAALQRLGNDFQFTEGPAANAQGEIFFTDLRVSRIYRIALDGKPSVWRENTAGANGLYFDAKGNLIVCESDNGRIVSISPAGDATVLAAAYNGKRFNKPNDLWIDNLGNIYLTVDSVLVFNAAGKQIDQIQTADQPTNVTFGGADRKTLFITARSTVQSIQTRVRGIRTVNSGTSSISGFVLIDGGSFAMGDHHGLGGQEHRNDEVPVHTVTIDALYVSAYETTNTLYRKFLQEEWAATRIRVENGNVYGDGGLYFETRAAVSHSHIDWDGSDAFKEQRPGWNTPIHPLLVQNKVSVVFHGHDHFYAKQDLDGIVYQLVSQPGHSKMQSGARSAIEYGYRDGVFLGSSGHLRFSVTPAQTTIDYIRSYLPGEKTGGPQNGEVAHSYTLSPGP